MNTAPLAEALRVLANDLAKRAQDGIDDDRLKYHQLVDAAELLHVLRRMVEGKNISQSFGAPGDWGYEHPIGAALSTLYRGGGA